MDLYGEIKNIIVEEKKITFESEFFGPLVFTGSIYGGKPLEGKIEGKVEGKDINISGTFKNFNIYKGMREFMIKNICYKENGIFNHTGLIFGKKITSFQGIEIIYNGKFKGNLLSYGEKIIPGIKFLEAGCFKDDKLIFGFTVDDNKNSSVGENVTLHPAYYIDGERELHFISFYGNSEIENNGFKTTKGHFVGCKLTDGFEGGIFKYGKLTKGIRVSKDGNKEFI